VGDDGDVADVRIATFHESRLLEWKRVPMRRGTGGEERRIG
jgi:hypothetical protein